MAEHEKTGDDPLSNIFDHIKMGPHTPEQIEAQNRIVQKWREKGLIRDVVLSPITSFSNEDIRRLREQSREYYDDIAKETLGEL